MSAGWEHDGSRPHIVIDIPRRFEEELFDENDFELLSALGPLTRTGGSGGDERLNADVLISGWDTPRLPDRRADAGRLRFVAHSAGSIRPIVPRSLIEDGVLVSQAAAGMATSVAELALYLTIALLRSLHRVDREMHVHSDWEAATSFGLGTTIADATIGVVGASRVGREYIWRVRMLGAKVLVSDPYLSKRDAARLDVELVGLDDLLMRSPVVALHAPVTPETVGLIGADRLALIRDQGIVINTARSALLDTVAFERELVSGRLNAALDVFDLEPLPASSALWGLPNVMLFPHIGAVTRHSRRAQADIVIQEVTRFCSGGRLEFAVSAEEYERLA